MKSERAWARLEALYRFDRAVTSGLVLDETTNVTHYRLVGCDEAGRGALAGPACVACVSIPGFVPTAGDSLPTALFPLLGVDDSKRLTPAKRERLIVPITQLMAVGIGWAPPAEIDRIGIVPALGRAAARAYRAVGVDADLLLLDRGLSVAPEPARGVPHPRGLSFTRGDSRSLHIAAASIVAKVTRDRLMIALDHRVPGYGFAVHKGYGTQAHRAAIVARGPSPIHRKSFRVR